MWVNKYMHNHLMQEITPPVELVIHVNFIPLYLSILWKKCKINLRKHPNKSELAHFLRDEFLWKIGIFVKNTSSVGLIIAGYWQKTFKNVLYSFNLFVLNRGSIINSRNIVFLKNRGSMRLHNTGEKHVRK